MTGIIDDECLTAAYTPWQQPNAGHFDPVGERKPEAARRALRE